MRHYERQLAADGPGSLYKSIRSDLKMIEKHVDDMLNQMVGGRGISNSIRDIRKQVNEIKAIIHVLRRNGR